MVLKLDNAELVSRSDLVVYGVVQETRIEAQGRVAVVGVKQVLKGDVAGRQEVKVRFSTGVEDSADFKKGEYVLLYLWKTGADEFQTVGGFQGKFSF